MISAGDITLKSKSAACGGDLPCQVIYEERKKACDADKMSKACTELPAENSSLFKGLQTLDPAPNYEHFSSLWKNMEQKKVTITDALDAGASAEKKKTAEKDAKSYKVPSVPASSTKKELHSVSLSVAALFGGELQSDGFLGDNGVNPGDDFGIGSDRVQNGTSQSAGYGFQLGAEYTYHLDPSHIGFSVNAGLDISALVLEPITESNGAIEQDYSFLVEAPIHGGVAYGFLAKETPITLSLNLKYVLFRSAKSLILPRSGDVSNEVADGFGAYGLIIEPKLSVGVTDSISVFLSAAFRPDVTSRQEIEPANESVDAGKDVFNIGLQGALGVEFTPFKW